MTKPRSFDIMSGAKRSALMSRIRGSDTGPELLVRQLLHGLGYRYRLHVRTLPGRPDIVFPSRRAVVFVHGCFWHRHDCGLAYTPKTRAAFWKEKFARNVERDRDNRWQLVAQGWKVLVIWQCELESTRRLSSRLVRFLGPPGSGQMRPGARSARR
jgi:DNA mismatch endonuclease (patch repair protein)